MTPNQGVYFQFDGRQGRDEVIQRDPQKILEAVNAEYLGDGLDVRSYRKLEALLLTRYDAGARLIVKSVKIDRDAVRLGFVEAAGSNDPDALAATLTVKWPVPLTKALTERPLIENLVRQYVDFPASRVRIKAGPKGCGFRLSRKPQLRRYCFACGFRLKPEATNYSLATAVSIW